MEEKILDKMFKIAENMFKTKQDSEQIPITKKSWHKLLKLHPKGLTYMLDKKKEPIGWVVVVPTTKELAEDFLDCKITEKELFDRTKPLKKYGALYLCAAIVLPEYRRRGYATKLFKKAVKGIPHDKDAILFYWPFSKEGRNMVKKMEKKFKIKIKERAR